MKILILSLAALLAAGCAHHGAPEAAPRAASQAAEGQTDLDTALRGRIAGSQQDCVSERELGGGESHAEGVLLFRGVTDQVIYANRPASGCPGLEFGRAIRTRRTSSRLCSGDLITVFDPTTGVEYGTCRLGEFTPYRRAP
jgi:hypothetical protein